eukprot:g1769.t1
MDSNVRGMKGGRGKRRTKGLGKALARDWRNPEKRKTKTSRSNQRNARHITDLDGDHGLTSILEASTLDDFLQSAVLAGRKFTAVRENVQLIGEDGFVEGESIEEAGTVAPLKKTSLKIPRRPAWTAETTAEELDELERSSFLQWRREVAACEAEEEKEEGRAVTPFEKNLDVWRQL